MHDARCFKPLSVWHLLQQQRKLLWIRGAGVGRCSHKYPGIWQGTKAKRTLRTGLERPTVPWGGSGECGSRTAGRAQEGRRGVPLETGGKQPCPATGARGPAGTASPRARGGQGKGRAKGLGLGLAIFPLRPPRCCPGLSSCHLTPGQSLAPWFPRYTCGQGSREFLTNPRADKIRDMLNGSHAILG